MRYRLKEFFSNVLNKSPKIIFIVLILYGISLNKERFFGHDLSSNSEITVSAFGFPQDVLNNSFHSDVLLSTTDSIYFTASERGSDSLLGGVISSIPFTNSWNGYGGTTPVLILLDQGQVIKDIVLLENSETPRFIERLRNEGFFDQWKGRHIFDQVHADAVSGATMSSSSIISNVNSALGAVVASKEESDKPFSGYLEQFAILAVLTMALLSMLFPIWGKKFRLVLLITSVGVLGIWQGAFVSIDLLYNWLINGTSVIERFGVATMVLGAIIVPLFFNKAFYCQYICPFGAAQELAGKMTKKKVKVPHRAVWLFHWVRRLALVGIVLLLLVNPNFVASDVEPFSVFLWRSAAVSTIIIAGLSLVTAIFINKPWCRLLCPTGEVLSLLLRKINYRKK